jgi:hypothetical protein
MKIIKYEDKYYKFIDYPFYDFSCTNCAFCHDMFCSKYNCDGGYYVEINIKEIRKQKIEKINNGNC